MIILNSKSKEPIYQQLKIKITELIGAGALVKNEQLPPVRVMARDLGVNPNTVQRAYTELEVQGIIYQIVGKGSFVSGDDSASEMLITQKLDDIKQEFQKSKQLGVKKKQVTDILDQVFREGDNND